MIDNEFSAIYKKLYAYFGPQHWWPGDTPFEVMVGAILTQGTNWGNVEKAINNLKARKVLSPHRIYRLPVKVLASLITSAGYYNIKAKRLKEFLNFFFKTYRADIKRISSGNIKDLRRELLEVKGIGPETADSILLYALNKPIFVVDAYTKRVLSRHRIIQDDATYDEIQNLFMKNIRKEVKLFNEYHALLVKLGKEFCLKNKPRCNLCPLGGRKKYA